MMDIAIQKKKKKKKKKTWKIYNIKIKVVPLVINCSRDYVITYINLNPGTVLRYQSSFI